MEKQEYEELEKTANRLQSASSEKTSSKIAEAQAYDRGYIQGVEDLLKFIRADKS